MSTLETAIKAKQSTTRSNAFRERMNKKISEMNQHKTARAIITGVKAVWNVSPAIGFYALKFGVEPNKLFLYNSNAHVEANLLKFGVGVAISMGIYAISNKEQMRIIFGRETKADT